MKLKDKFYKINIKKQIFFLEYYSMNQTTIRKLVYVEKIYKKKIICFEKINSFLKSYLVLNILNIKKIEIYDKNIHFL